MSAFTFSEEYNVTISFEIALERTNREKVELQFSNIIPK